MSNLLRKIVVQFLLLPITTQLLTIKKSEADVYEERFKE